jgi:hypothetical protein
MNSLFRFSTTALAVAIATMDGAMAQYEEVPLEEHPAYNPNEELGTFDLIMKPYPIPVKTTTYTNFYFNLPDELPEHFHAVFGEVINSQPNHLHHFVLTGCPNKVDATEEAQPFEDDLAAGFVSETTNLNCQIPLGGWAPGSSVFGVTDIETGILMGRGMGVQAVQMNVHYTDGAYEDPEAMTLKMAIDGIRVHYTPTFRPYSSAVMPLISIGAGPGRLAIPPGESRFYVTRTCKIGRNCQDATTEQIQQMMEFMTFMGFDEADVGNFMGGGEISCPTVKPFCNVPGDVGSQIKRLCPATCGLCEESELNPFTPESYRLTAINYHAHLLGREMYTTLLREENKIEAGEDIVSDTAVKVEREIPTPAMTPIDIESRPFWIFDFQEMIPLEFDIVKENNSDSIMRGVEVKPGDKIQATCVFDSTYRNESTQFERSTYDEMCIVVSYVTFKTPESLVTGGDGLVDINTELHLLRFGCLEDEETDVYTGTLTEDEDARDIWKDHPIADAEGCTFPNIKIMGFSTLSFQARNCPTTDTFVCGDLEMSPDVNAGASCTGGTYNEQDANDGITKEQCEEGGGVYSPYTCLDADYWVVNEAENDGVDSDTAALLVDNWWKPKCCVSDDDSSSSSEVEKQQEEDMGGETENEEDLDIKEDLDSDPVVSAASDFIGSSTFLAVVSAIVAMAL